MTSWWKPFQVIFDSVAQIRPIIFIIQLSPDVTTTRPPSTYQVLFVCARNKRAEKISIYHQNSFLLLFSADNINSLSAFASEQSTDDPVKCTIIATSTDNEKLLFIDVKTWAGEKFSVLGWAKKIDDALLHPFAKKKNRFGAGRLLCAMRKNLENGRAPLHVSHTGGMNVELVMRENELLFVSCWTCIKNYNRDGWQARNSSDQVCSVGWRCHALITFFAGLWHVVIQWEMSSVRVMRVITCDDLGLSFNLIRWGRSWRWKSWNISSKWIIQGRAYRSKGKDS